ncbi:MAG: PA0069 family radical SAM protein [Gammaproteobacteria bacterium]|nr:MAG: PA0069 family radical SAM protein [Gammaproteobacteria bacterium]
MDTPIQLRRGRGAASSPAGRFAASTSAWTDDGWGGTGTPDLPASIATEVLPERARSIIARNDSPDIPFSQSINPYRGCEHGCVYCFARPAHAYVDLSPGLDFETRLFYKADAAALLAKALARPGYVCRPIAIGTNTDPYQPIERRLKVMQSLLEVLDRHEHPLSITTKGVLLLRDLDRLAAMAERGLVRVAVSLTTLDGELKRRLEPRTADPSTRLRMIRCLHEAGVPVSVMTAPIIPGLNDHELEDLLAAAAAAGASRAGYILLRLPHEVAALFRDWLELHYPDRAAHVLSLIRQCRGGADYDARFGQRMVGTGPFARLLGERFRLAVRRLGLDGQEPPLDCSRFRAPSSISPQLALF